MHPFQAPKACPSRKGWGSRVHGKFQVQVPTRNLSPIKETTFFSNAFRIIALLATEKKSGGLKSRREEKPYNDVNHKANLKQSRLKHFLCNLLRVKTFPYAASHRARLI